MSIPSYQDFMNPVLQVYAKSGDIMKRTDVIDAVVNILNLTPEDINKTLKSGEPIVSSRVYWAAYFMFRAGLLERVKRGSYKITDEGKRVASSGDKVDDAYLMKYPDFVNFMNVSNTGKKTKAQSAPNTPDSTCQTPIDPEEMLESAINDLNSVLEDDILSNLKTVDPRRFETIVVDLMEAMDYGVGTPTRYVADGGIDGIIDEDELGLSKIYLQAKRYTDSKVNEKEMRDFVGALATNNVNKGVFITTSEFSEKAEKAAKGAHGYTIVLINGTKLAQLMREHGLGAKPKKNYDVKEFDASYFEIV